MGSETPDIVETQPGGNSDKSQFEQERKDKGKEIVSFEELDMHHDNVADILDVDPIN
jgi:hypothetical protein